MLATARMPAQAYPHIYEAVQKAVEVLHKLCQCGLVDVNIIAERITAGWPSPILSSHESYAKCCWACYVTFLLYVLCESQRALFAASTARLGHNDSKPSIYTS